ncbi:MAG: hypothetical protein AVDCRST_MAG30-1354 [uncultured Solirubrobacteraceae bacterium]|uniref:Uncharacterized protein n=1 Tax=uncultured Solirubrobacteraceae bacterium TaxID=1162706 RepID=A0A6J4S672_9ACTN|nr:MAG: hypothetical protein AVDCRST_MAG30-1354 [uncultured Solirubrobacteraceae bacterium]
MARIGIPPPEPDALTWQVLGWGASFALFAASGFMRRRARRRARMRGGEMLRFILFHTVVRATLLEAVVRWAAKVEREREVTRARLAAELGREPTEEELHEAVMERYVR